MQTFPRGAMKTSTGLVGPSVCVKTHTESGSVPGTGGRLRFDPGDLEIEVEWLQRDVSGGDERRTFCKWEATTANAAAGVVADPGPVAGQTYTFNSTELRAVSL